MKSPRVPFEFTLVDIRHQPFAEGKRDRFLSFFQLWRQEGLFSSLVMLALPAFFLYLSVPELLHNAMATWIEETATVNRIQLWQRGDGFNYHYVYGFEVADGQRYSGTWVLDNPNVFEVGDPLRVRYEEADPANNRPVNESLPKSTLLWLYVGIAIVISIPFWRLMLRLFNASAWQRRLAETGAPMTGVITEQRTLGLDTTVAYRITDERAAAMIGPTPGRGEAHVPSSALNREDPPIPGKVVAVWLSPNGVSARVL